jgi:hypothetical protein
VSVSIAAIEDTFDELAEMLVRAELVAVAGDALERDAGAAQADRVARVFAELDPASETGAIFARVLALGTRARAAVGRALARTSISRLAVAGGLLTSYAILAPYMSAQAKADLQTAQTEDQVMREIIAALPPEKRAAAFAAMRGDTTPSWILPAALVAGGLILWRLAK